MLSFLKQLFPIDRREALKWRWRLILIKRALRNIHVGQVPSESELARLRKAWTNEGWSGTVWYLGEVARQAATTTEPILECGSGLTTIVAAALAGRRGIPVHSLEHIPEWAVKVRQALDDMSLSAQVHTTELYNYGDFDWYRVPDNLPSQFGLVICDGPPGETRGGRVGLMPVLGNRLSAHGVILLDDVYRQGEQQIAKFWSENFALEYEVRKRDSADAYMVARYSANAGRD